MSLVWAFYTASWDPVKNIQGPLNEIWVFPRTSATNTPSSPLCREQARIGQGDVPSSPTQENMWPNLAVCRIPQSECTETRSCLSAVFAKYWCCLRSSLSLEIASFLIVKRLCGALVVLSDYPILIPCSHVRQAWDRTQISSLFLSLTMPHVLTPFHIW